MIRIESFQQDNLDMLKAGNRFMGNRRKVMRALSVDMNKGTVKVEYLISKEIAYLDLIGVLRGLDTRDYIWC